MDAERSDLSLIAYTLPAARPPDTFRPAATSPPPQEQLLDAMTDKGAELMMKDGRITLGYNDVGGFTIFTS